LGADGQPLNVDFERGTLEHWVADGDAFKGQPIKGDTVHPRRPDSHSQHDGDYWIGTFEVSGDKPKGTLTSAPFRVTHRWASFLFAGGSHRATRVELLDAKSNEKLFQVSGTNSEDLKGIIVDLKAHQDKEIVIRLVDGWSGGWGHVNFDRFRFHDRRPSFGAKYETPQLDAFAHEGLEPEEAARAMTLPEGFKVTLAAAEPDVVQPIAMALDHRGRLWVAEAYSYPIRLKEDEAHDRILIFEDRDGDGRLEHRKVFAENLNLVSGLEVGFGGVWVGSAPHLLFIPDADGDDHPDGPPQVLLDGWGYHDTHETLNAFIWGPDGWLYGCHGVFTHSLVGKPGTPEDDRTPLNAAIWRYHPTRHEFEVFAHGTSNPWGVDFNDHGQSFCTACVIPHLYHVIQGARYQRQAGQHFNRYTYDDIKTIADHRHYVGDTPHSGNNRSDDAGGGHAHAGAMIYLGGSWPPEYRGQIFMNNIHGARINMDILKRDGSGFVGSHGDDFIFSNDRWSQIVNLRYGPDGGAYMIDWYDKNQCHRRETEMHDRTNGRIFKVSYGTGPGATGVDLRSQDDLALVELQLDRNDWFVRHARKVLQERAAGGAIDPAAVKRLEEIALTHDDATRRLRAIWTLHVTGNLDESLELKTLDDKDEYVRGWTIQCEMEDGELSPRVGTKLQAMAESDPSPLVRLYLASALLRMPREARWELLAALMSHAEDAEDHNLPLMYWYAAEPLTDEDPRRALESVTAAEVPLPLAFAVRKIGSDGKPESLALLTAHLGTVQSDSQRLIMLEGINLALRGRRQVEMPEAWPEVSKRLALSDSAEVRSRAKALAVTFGDPEALAAMREIVADADAKADQRKDALASLLGAKDKQLAPLLQELVADAQLQREALRGLAGYDDKNTPGVILSAYADLSPAAKRDALNTLASRVSYAKALLNALDEKQVATADVTADIIRQLRNLKDEKLNERIVEAWGTVRSTPLDKTLLIKQYQEMLTKAPRNEPDLSHGRAVFAKTCQQCHTLFGVGDKVGPELTGSNRANLDYLLSNVLDPSALIAKDYMPITIVTDDGRVITGLVMREDPGSLTIRTANESLVVPRDEIDEMEPSTKSMMPDDLFKPLSEQDVRALVAYLASPAQVPMLATAENAQSLFNGRDLSGWRGNESIWQVEDGEIVGKTTQLLTHNEFLGSDMLVGDFRLSLQVKLVPNAGNSGIQFRSQIEPNGHAKGYQADIGKGWWGKLYEELGRGLLSETPGDEYLKPEQWNKYVIEARGSRIRTYLNGNLCVDLDDPAGAKKGVLALQVHSGPPMEVRFKDLVLEVNPSSEKAAAKKTAEQQQADSKQATRPSSE
jgi:putative membrane-bound dehydrogenase-like protein